MFTCPVCGKRGVSTASRFFGYLYEPLRCRICAAPLFAHPLQGAAGSAVTLLFAVLGFVVLGSAWYWLVAVLALFVAARIAIALALPLTAGRRFRGSALGTHEP